MIYLVGGAGYIGRHVQKALREKNMTYRVLDPNGPEGGLGSRCPALSNDWVVWLAGPRNSGARVTQKAHAALIEADFDRFLEHNRRCSLLFVSSMSIYDHMESEYQKHKLRMEFLFNGYRSGPKFLIRPGTVVGTTDDVRVLRADTAANAIMLSAHKTGKCWMNARCVRCWTPIQHVVQAIVECIERSTVIQTNVFVTVAPLVSLFFGLTTVQMTNDETPCPTGLPSANPELVPVVQQCVRETQELLKSGPVEEI